MLLTLGGTTRNGSRDHGPPSPPGCRVPSVGSSLQGPSWPRRQVRPFPTPCPPGLSLEVKLSQEPWSLTWDV